jgi:hypothetical protein
MMGCSVVGEVHGAVGNRARWGKGRVAGQSGAGGCEFEEEAVLVEVKK